MPILTRYLVKSFFRFFMVIQLVVMLIFISVDYLTNIDKFIKSGISLPSGLGYVILKIPFMFVQLTPAGVVLAVVTVFGLMNRNNELLAIKAGGISTYSIVMPAVAAGASLALVMFFLGETVVPLTMSKANHIKYAVIKKNRNVHAIRENIWIKGDDSISHFKYFNPVDKTIAGITITFMNRNFEVTGRVDAESGKFYRSSEAGSSVADNNSRKTENSAIQENGKWILSGVIEQIFDRKLNDFVIKKYEKKEFDIGLQPDDLKTVVKKSDEMAFMELAAHIRKVENEGYDATSYKVDLLGKSAFPFICVIMSIIGAATGMRRFVRDNLASGIGIGVAASLLYWIGYGFFTSLGYARILPPFISAWAANFIFLCAAVIYLLYTE